MSHHILWQLPLTYILLACALEIYGYVMEAIMEKLRKDGKI